MNPPRRLSSIRNTWSIIRHVAHRNRRSIRQSAMRGRPPLPFAPATIHPVWECAVVKQPARQFSRPWRVGRADTCHKGKAHEEPQFARCVRRVYGQLPAREEGSGESLISRSPWRAFSFGGRVAKGTCLNERADVRENRRKTYIRFEN